jgi:hypothetical protein
MTAEPGTGLRVEESLELLRTLSTVHGIRASASAAANYNAVFARDAVMAGFAGLLAGDESIGRGFAATLTRLRDLQGTEGQIPSNYQEQPGGSPRVSFGTLAPRIDAVTWYLIGVAAASHGGLIDPGVFHTSVRAAVRLLDALEYNGRNLIYIPPGGNWADEYVYEGYVLYDQVLRAWGLRLVGSLYNDSAWTAKAARIAQTIARDYFPRASAERRPPLSSWSPLRISEAFDLAACSLLGLSQTAPDLASIALDVVGEHYLEAERLPPVFDPVIDEQHPDWPALRSYHLYEFRNHPYEYHNGGIWPIWLGWLGLAMRVSGVDRSASLAQLRSLVVSRIVSRPDFAFDEFFHGRSGFPGGNRHMAYTATGLLLLHAATEGTLPPWISR